MTNDNGKLTMEEILAQAAGNEPETQDPEPQEPEPADPQEPEPQEPETQDPEPQEPETVEPEPEDTKPKSNPLKDLRDKYTSEKSTREKIDSAIQKFSVGDYDFSIKDFVVDGKMDYDAFAQAMEDADIEAAAKAKGIKPEVQAEIERMERERVELEKEKLQVAMDRALTNFQLELNLKGDEINQFFKDALAVKKNPYSWIQQGGTLQDLYNILYRDKIMQSEIDKAVSAARAKWDEEAVRSTKTPAPNPANPPRQDSNPSNGLTMSQLLEEAAKRRR